MIELTDQQASVLKRSNPVRIFIPKSVPDRIALADRANTRRVPRKIASRHIAQHHPSTIAVGLEARGG